MSINHQTSMSKPSDHSTLKKLMKIIYEKEKQIDKYKRMLRNKEQPVGQPCATFGITLQEKEEIAKEIMENKKFLETATAKIYAM